MSDELPGFRPHRPGRQTRIPEIGRFLADNPSADPMIGNYVVLACDDIVIGYESTSSANCAKIYTAKHDASRGFDLIPVGSPGAAAAIAGTALACAGGDIDGDHRDELLTLALHEGSLSLLVSRVQDAGSPEVLRTVPLGACGPGPARIVVGPFLSNVASVAVGWLREDSQLEVQLWSFDRSLTPTRHAAFTVARVGAAGCFDLSGGDLDGDGYWELVAAWAADPDPGADKTTSGQVALTCHSFRGGDLESSRPITVGELGDARQIALATGPFSSTTVTEQVAVAWSDPDDRARCVVCTIEGGELAACGSAFVDATYTLTDCRQIALAAGDLNNDGTDELVLGVVTTDRGVNAAVGLHVFTADNLLQLTEAHYGAVSGPANEPLASIDLALGCGLIGDAAHGIVVAGRGASMHQIVDGSASVRVGLVEVDPGTLAFPPDWAGPVPPVLPHLVSADDASNDAGTLCLALADVTGNSVRLGPPTPFPVERINQVLGIINVPPGQRDVDFGLGEAYLSFSDSRSETTAIGVTINRAWTVSAGLQSQLGYAIANFTGSVTATYGRNFSKTKDSSHTTSEHITNTLYTDDLIIASATGAMVWEYPVYRNTGGTADSPPIGHMLVVFPEAETAETLRLQGMSDLVGYAPEHIVGALLSYSSEPPSDYRKTNLIGNLNEIDVGDSSMMLMYDWMNHSTKSEQSTTDIQLAVNASAGLSGPFQFLGNDGNIGLTLHLNGHYSKSKLSTHSVSYQETTSITVSYPILQNPLAEYQVTPLIYFAEPSGCLTVNYLVNINARFGHWKDSFSTPAPTFSLPLANSMEPEAARWKSYTRSISFEKRDDGTIVVTARVVNLSFVPAEGVVVEFFRSDPRQPGAQSIGKLLRIRSIAPRARSAVSVEWDGKSPGNPERVYAQITMPDWKAEGSGQTYPAVVGFNVWPPQAF